MKKHMKYIAAAFLLLSAFATIASADTQPYWIFFTDRGGVNIENGRITKLDSWELVPEYKVRRGYRLPTEKEWEYACRSGTTTVFAFGSDYSLTKHYGWFLDNRDDNYAMPVATKMSTLRGLYDMHGSMLEWCQDRFNVDTNDQLADILTKPLPQDKFLGFRSFYVDGKYIPFNEGV